MLGGKVGWRGDLAIAVSKASLGLVDGLVKLRDTAIADTIAAARADAAARLLAAFDPPPDDDPPPAPKPRRRKTTSLPGRKAKSRPAPSKPKNDRRKIARSPAPHDGSAASTGSDDGGLEIAPRAELVQPASPPPITSKPVASRAERFAAIEAKAAARRGERPSPARVSELPVPTATFDF